MQGENGGRLGSQAPPIPAPFWSACLLRQHRQPEECSAFSASAARHGVFLGDHAQRHSDQGCQQPDGGGNLQIEIAEGMEAEGAGGKQRGLVLDIGGYYKDYY